MTTYFDGADEDGTKVWEGDPDCCWMVFTGEILEGVGCTLGYPL